MVGCAAYPNRTVGGRVPSMPAPGCSAFRWWRSCSASSWERWWVLGSSSGARERARRRQRRRLRALGSCLSSSTGHWSAVPTGVTVRPRWWPGATVAGARRPRRRGGSEGGPGAGGADRPAVAHRGATGGECSSSVTAPGATGKPDAFTSASATVPGPQALFGVVGTARRAAEGLTGAENCCGRCRRRAGRPPDSPFSAPRGIPGGPPASGGRRGRAEARRIPPQGRRWSRARSPRRDARRIPSEGRRWSRARARRDLAQPPGESQGDAEGAARAARSGSGPDRGDRGGLARAAEAEADRRLAPRRAQGGRGLLCSPHRVAGDLDDDLTGFHAGTRGR